MLEPGRVLQAGHLYQNAVGAFALDQRLDGAELVDAPPDDLDRLVHRLTHALDNGRIGIGEPDDVTGLGGHVDVALAGGTEDAAERLRQRAQFFQRQVGVRALADVHLGAVALDDETGIADARLAQHAAHVVEQRLQHLLAHGLGVDLEQDVRAALQVEAEHDVALRPFRPARHHLFRQEIGNGEQANEDCRKDNRRRLPTREIEHDVPT